MSSQNKAGAALEQRRENSADAEGKALSKMIRDMAGEFQKAMPRGAEAQQLVRDALTCLRTTPKLAQCEAQSVLGALMTTGQLGLHVGVLGQAWPVPFWDGRSKGFKAQLIIGYQGYQELAHRNGKVASFMPRVVYANDEFDIDYGINGTLVHKPARGSRGEAVGFHSIARYTNGGYDFLFMTREEMEEHRDKYATARDRNDRTKVIGPWVDHFEAMGMKTTQRILSKSMPKSRELAVAAFVDGGLRIDLRPTVDPEEVTTQPDVMVGEIVEPDDAAADDNAGPCVDRQRKRIMSLVDELGMLGHRMDRDERLSYYGQIVKRPIDSTNSLTFGEAEKVIATMVAFKKQQEGEG